MSQMQLLLLSLTGLFLYTTAIELEKFYPFGPDAGDSELDIDNPIVALGDEQVLVWPTGTIFFTMGYVDIYSISTYCSRGVFWLRNKTTPDTTERALKAINYIYPSVTHINHTVVVTWNHSHPHNTKSNIFQAVVARSGDDTYVISLYADGLIQWASADGGSSMLYPSASVGYALNPNKFTLPGSQTCSIIHIASRSNIGTPGVFVFHRNGTHSIFVSECEEGDVRLVDSNIKINASGRVEMCLSNEWRIVGDETWGVEEATVVCRQLGLPTDEVLVGWNLKSAGVPIQCDGDESQLMNCSVDDMTRSMNCRGGATTTTCLAADDECEGLFQDPYSPEICLNRYGSCVPFSEYMLGSGIPCDRVYDSGTDYVYIKNSIESIQTLNLIWEIEEEFQEDSYCKDATIRMICHYYLPPCGNSTHFEPPTSVCSDACYLLSQMCPTHWGDFESELRGERNPLNCLYVENVHPLNHSCSDLGVYMNILTIELEEKHYQVREDEGRVKVCATVNSNYDVECAVPSDFHVHLIVSNGTAGLGADYENIQNLSFIACEEIACTTISIVDDDVVETNESFTISLGRTSDLNKRISLSPDSKQVTILDDDESANQTVATEDTAITVLAVLVVVLFCGICTAVVFIAVHQRRAKVMQRKRRWDVTPTLDHQYSFLSDDRRADILQQIQEKLERKKMIYSKDRIELTATIGQGESGLVYRGYIKTAVGNELIAVKTGKALFSTGDLQTLVKEVSTMLSFKHDNLMSLMGVCIDGEMPLLIMPFMSNGSVLEYVKNHKGKLLISRQFIKEEAQSACKTLLRISLHIAKGMEYLSRHKFVHRDLAARNCMIDGEGVIKVADFGLTEGMHNSYYIRRRRSQSAQEKVPIRWMAPESIENCIYTEVTDVWAYGVTVWEIFTCGRVPYAGIHAMCLLPELKKGQRLEKPNNKACHDNIYAMMLSCWGMKAGERPKFSDLVITVSDLLERDAGYLELSVSGTSKAATLSPLPSFVHPVPGLTELAVVEEEESGCLSNDFQ